MSRGLFRVAGVSMSLVSSFLYVSLMIFQSTGECTVGVRIVVVVVVVMITRVKKIIETIINTKYHYVIV